MATDYAASTKDTHLVYKSIKHFLFQNLWMNFYMVTDNHSSEGTKFEVFADGQFMTGAYLEPNL